MLLVHCVSKKNIPNIFDFNLKTNCQIMITFGKNIHGTTCHQTTIQFPLHPTFVSALPGENTTSKISLFHLMQYDCLINITRKNTFYSHF